MKKEFTFASIPGSLSEFKALPEANLQDPFGSVALSVLAFCLYPKDSAAALEILDFLKGPDSISPYEKSFIRDRFSDKDYVPRSFLKGTSVENSYEPTKPYTIEVSDNPYSYTNENYATLYIVSSGADSPRPVRVRKKPSTGEWFLNEYGGILAGIRIPTALDPWA